MFQTAAIHLYATVQSIVALQLPFVLYLLLGLIYRKTFKAIFAATSRIITLQWFLLFTFKHFRRFLGNNCENTETYTSNFKGNLMKVNSGTRKWIADVVHTTNIEISYTFTFLSPFIAYMISKKACSRRDCTRQSQM